MKIAWKKLPTKSVMKHTARPVLDHITPRDQVDRSWPGLALCFITDLVGKIFPHVFRLYFHVPFLLNLIIYYLRYQS